jgi:iron complex outermembrane receptor protein
MHTARPLALLAAALTLAAARAQIAAPPRPPAAPPSDEIVKLERFVVETTLDSYRTADAAATLKSAAPLRTTPFTVQVANAALLADLRAETLAAVYPYLTGLSASGTRADSFTLRGFSSNRESVQVDGLPGNTTIFGSPPSANVERVELLKGPASVLYGALAPGGIVNLVTKRPLARARHEVSASLRSYAGRISPLGDDLGAQLTLDSGGPLTRDTAWRYRLVARYEEEAAFRRHVFGDRLLVAPALGWTSAAGTAVIASLEYLDESGRADAGLVAPGNNLGRLAPADTRYQARADADADSGLALALNATHAFARDARLHLAWRSVWHDDRRTLYENNALQTVAGESVLRRQFRDQANERQYHFLDARWEQPLATGPLTHRVLVGLNGGREQRFFDRRSMGPLVGTVSILAPQTDLPRPAPVPGSLRETWLDNSAAYVRDTFTWGDGWHGLLALRYTAQDVAFESFRDGLAAAQSTSALVPSLGLVREFGPAWSLYASYGQSFIPASVEREDLNGNTGLPPERARQAEAGLKYERPDGLLGASLALFQITQFDLAESLGVLNRNGNTAFGLVGEARSRGAECDVQWQPRPHLQLRAGASYLAERAVTAARNPAQVGAPLTNAPRWQGHLWTRYNVATGALRGLGAGLGVVGVSAREAVSTTSPTARLTLPGYLRTDLALYWTRGRTGLALNLQNAADRAYLASASSPLAVIPGEPRQLTLSVRRVW